MATPLLVAALALGCSGASEINTDLDGGGSGPGESCLRTSDCQADLACVNLVCTPNRPDGGRDDGGRLGNVGDSCVRTVDCVEPLRCVAQRCAVPTDGGATSSSSSGGGTSSSSSGGSYDGGLPRSGCADPGPTPRGVGGCCATNDECASGLCVTGTCSAHCTTDDECAVTAPATPFASTVDFTCGVFPGSPTGRACLPGSLAACVPGGCPSGEACVPMGSATADGGAVVTLRCTSRRVNAVRTAGACTTGTQCEAFSPYVDNCRQGVCRSSCVNDSSCATAEQCIPAAQEGPGVCEGISCGTAPSGSDLLCEDGRVCVPSQIEGGADTSRWQPQCAPDDPGALPLGSLCTLETEERCARRTCVANTCTALCRSDADCPSTLPFCVEAITESGRTVASCTSVPAATQVCLRESDCGRAGCRYLSPRSNFSTCSLGGTSLTTDAECGASRYCPGDSVCLPDENDTLRCTTRTPVGGACASDAECLSGRCVDADGQLTESSRCTSRCLTAADCATGMTCRSSVSIEEQDVQVVHTWCWPQSPTSGRCTTDDDCTTANRGTACEALHGACYTPEAGAGSACTDDTDCSFGLRCGTPLGLSGVCVRDGCIPDVSGGGCGTGEICVRTGELSAECRLACMITPECRAVNEALTCVGATTENPGHCTIE